MVKILIHSEVTKQKFAIPLHMPYHYMQKSMDYLLARMYQYVGKSENSFNIRLNNHREDVSNPKAILVYVYFRKEGRNFIQHAEFTLID